MHIEKSDTSVSPTWSQIQQRPGGVGRRVGNWTLTAEIKRKRRRDMARMNRQWLIAERPNNRSLQATDFTWTTTEARSPGPGEVLLRTLYLSFDPSQKGQMENIGGYAAPTQIGDVMRAGGVGEVVESRSPLLKPGDNVMGSMGWQEPPSLQARDLMKVSDGELLTEHLGALGGTGMTAYSGLSELGQPFPGDTV